MSGGGVPLLFSCLPALAPLTQPSPYTLANPLAITPLLMRRSAMAIHACTENNPTFAAQLHSAGRDPLTSLIQSLGQSQDHDDRMTSISLAGALVAMHQVF